jgi:phosphate transport system ATP-binding protein
MDTFLPGAGMTSPHDGLEPLPPRSHFPALEPVSKSAVHIKTEHLEVSYHGRPALEHVNLTLRRGAITALVGPSGCGKTSLLMSLNRLTDVIPGCRVSGTLQIDRLDVLAPDTDLLHLRRMVGMVFQKPAVFPFSIRKNLELPLREHGIRDRPVLSATIEQGLRQVGLWDEVKERLDHPAQTLSGGQQQRLCLARALVLSPDILLLDEPCSALDPISSGIVEDLIAGLRGRYTIVIVTHNLAQARRLADHVAFFWAFDGIGRLVEQGPARDIFESPKEALTAAYLSGIRG